MKIALCFWGQPRFITNNSPYLAIKKYILDKFPTDVFVHTWFKEGGSMNGSNWSGINNHQFNPKTLDIIYDRYRENIKRLVWMAQPNFLEDDRFKPLRQQMYNHMNVSGPIVHDRNFDALCSQMVSTHETINLVKSFGANQYDWIIIMRQDVELLDLPDLNTLNPTKIYCGYTPVSSLKDDIFIFNPRFIPAFEMIDALQTYPVTPYFIPNSEHIRFFNCTKYIKSEDIIPISTDEKCILNTIRTDK